ncbi:hypothetical protein QYE76_065606 [Lolium multiflorum]|uniref:Retrotransposon protein n=1 Tax=Lolium multiflorum TaxID=4521 RepID=A0AAD8SAE9_LOLMU|nr:hypothetical protein QYE76_065606 [Lolium multiflorum]
MEHWTTVKNILKYLKRTKDMFLCYGGDQELVVTSYTDASWNTGPDDSKSQSGYVFMLNGAAVSWMSAKQCTVAKSSTESKYIAASEASSEAIWMKRFITELGVVPSALDPLVIYCDNMGAIANAQEPRSHKKLKHIKLRFHVIREGGGRGRSHPFTPNPGCPPLSSTTTLLRLGEALQFFSSSTTTTTTQSCYWDSEGIYHTSADSRNGDRTDFIYTVRTTEYGSAAGLQHGMIDYINNEI